MLLRQIDARAENHGCISLSSLVRLNKIGAANKF